MNIVSKAIKRIQNKGLMETVKLTSNITCGLMDFYLNPFAKKQSKLPHPDNEKIKSKFESSGLNVISYRINIPEFQKWVNEADFPENYKSSYGSIFIEKALEHYVGAKLLELKNTDMLMDIAASSSSWFEMAEKMYGCTAYALDYTYPKGINGKKIGADATNIPLPDRFATKMVLHCAYEMFEGDADIRLLPEAQRLLVNGGKMLILPLYMNNFYFADSSPRAHRVGLDYQGAERVWRDDGHIVRFSRKYSVEAFLQRIVNNMGNFKLKIYYIENEKEVSPECYLKFAAMFEKGDK
ncbi:hypothetical protein HY745_11770 [Candidatus Desantisbacteria bacterium]|nr:hypothetical protein [Candidatus Desantisbacteria bacterium]